MYFNGNRRVVHPSVQAVLNGRGRQPAQPKPRGMVTEGLITEGETESGHRLVIETTEINPLTDTIVPVNEQYDIHPVGSASGPAVLPRQFPVK